MGILSLLFLIVHQRDSCLFPLEFLVYLIVGWFCRLYEASRRTGCGEEHAHDEKPGYCFHGATPIFKSDGDTLLIMKLWFPYTEHKNRHRNNHFPTYNLHLSPGIKGTLHVFCTRQCYLDWLQKTGGDARWPSTVPCPRRGWRGNTSRQIKSIRADDPNRKAISIARELGISRERVRQILLDLGLPTKVCTRKYKRPIFYKGQPERVVDPAIVSIVKDILFTAQRQ